MTPLHSTDFFFGWGWILWFGFIFLVFSSVGNWGYSYRAHRKVDGFPSKDASAILNERYARGELTREQYLEHKADIASV
jgi:putative membrane protein